VFLKDHGLDYRLAGVLAVLVSSVVNYYASTVLAWRKKK
jgi:hypothetical protein